MKSATENHFRPHGARKARNPPAVHADGLRLARRTWDLNPRGFHLPVFKTGALGRYASPPWERLLEGAGFSKIYSDLSGEIEESFNCDSNAIFLAWAGDGFRVFRSIRVA